MAIPAGPELHEYAAKNLQRNDALLLGRVTYEMMESAFRTTTEDSKTIETDPFVSAIGSIRKYVVSNTLKKVDWNSELVQGDLIDAVKQLKNEPGFGIGLGGMQLPLAMAEAGLIDEYEFIVYPRVVGHGPSLFEGLTRFVDLRLVEKFELNSGAVAMRYEPIR